jgi:hypothetical protein
MSKSYDSDEQTHENMLTTPVQNEALMAASTAFPPSFNTSTPIFEQRSFSAATAPWSAIIRRAGLRPIAFEVCTA